MIEKILADYLRSVITEPVVFEHEPDEPERMVLLERTGGSMRDYLRSAMITVQSYGASLADAIGLHEEIRNVMLNAVTLDAVSSVKLNSEYNFTDPETKRYRYQAVFDIVYYQEEA